ncbi:MAG: hypothetical protein WC829_06960 [Hyphomicrobium sp.]|jgi:hypothetical protein
MKHMGNLTVTTENVHDFPAVTEIYGHLTIEEGVVLTAPALTFVRGWVTLAKDALLTARNLGEINGWLTMTTGSKLESWHLTKAGEVFIEPAAELDAPKLVIVTALNLQRDAYVVLPELQVVARNLTLLPGASLFARALERVDMSITLRERARLDAPMLSHIGGYYDGDPTATLVAPKFVNA